MFGGSPPKREWRQELERFLIENGNAGELPWYYPLIKAARFMGVPPWELAKQSIFWQDAALQVEAADSNAQIAIRNRSARHDAMGALISDQIRSQMN